MKISYIFQLKDFGIMLILGVILGIFYELVNLFSLVKKHIVFQIIADIIFSLVASVSFIIFINILNWGEFRLFLLIGYILGFAFERATCGKLIAKPIKKMYNWVIIKLKIFAKSKIGRMIFK